MFCLSIDCSNKSLAICYFNINYNWKNDILIVLNKYKYNINCQLDKLKYIFIILTEINKILDNIISFNFCKVTDLIPNKKVKDTSILERTLQLKYHIQDIKKIINKSDKNKLIHIYIEYQCNVNDKSRTVYNQLIYAFSDNAYYNIIIVKPTLKNQIYFSDKLKISNIRQLYNNNYISNKNHCKQNFLYFMNIFNKQHYIKNIKKSNLDDIGDAFLQCIAYNKFYNNIF